MARSSRAPCLVAVALLALLGCANDAIPVSTYYDPLVRFPATATYVWDDKANTLPDDSAIERTMKFGPLPM